MIFYHSIIEKRLFVLKKFISLSREISTSFSGFTDLPGKKIAFNEPYDYELFLDMERISGY